MIRTVLSISAVLGAMALVVLDASVSNIALPSIARAFDAPPATAIGVITSYQTALMVALLPCGALGERFGYRRVFSLGVTIFTAASLLCALAPTLQYLIIARFIQGLGGAAVLSLGVALLRLTLSDERLGAAISWNALTVALSTAAGPAIGGMMLAQFNWAWIYALNLPLGLLVLLFARALPKTSGSAELLDVTSMALNGAAFGCLVLSAVSLLQKPMFSAMMAVVGAVSLMALVRREWPKSAPLIPIDLLRHRSFRLSVIASVACFMGQTIALVALPFYLQHSLGLSPWTAGLYMIPWPLTVALTALFMGKFVSRISTSTLCTMGGIFLSLGLAGSAVWPLQDEPRWLIAFTMLCGLGFGLFQVPNNRTMFMAAPKTRSGAAGGMQGTARLFGQTSGALIMTLVFTGIASDIAPRVGLALGAAFTLAAAIVSLGRMRQRLVDVAPNAS